MSKRIGVTFGAGVAVAAILTTATGAAADWPRFRISDATRTFALSAEYTGFLGGDLLINGVVYRVAPQATVYLVGAGIVEPFVAIKRVVYLSGERRGNMSIVRNIIVRPAPVMAIDGASRSASVAVRTEPLPG